MSYYDSNARAFFDDTVSLDMSSLYDEFLPLLPKNATILDVGCGSGRDSRAFKDKGFQVVAVEPSAALAAFAQELIGQEVEITSIQQFQSNQTFNGVWACASLLHTPVSELPDVFARLSELLKLAGVMYCSFKYGERETIRGERVFTDLNETILANMLPSTLSVRKVWVTADLRQNRNEMWLNAVLVKG